MNAKKIWMFLLNDGICSLSLCFSWMHYVPKERQNSLSVGQKCWDGQTPFSFKNAFKFFKTETIIKLWRPIHIPFLFFFFFFPMLVHIIIRGGPKVVSPLISLPNCRSSCQPSEIGNYIMLRWHNFLTTLYISDFIFKIKVISLIWKYFLFTPPSSMPSMVRR